MKARKIISVLLVSALTCAMLFASSAENLYEDFSLAVENGDLSGAMESYADLEERLSDELSSANKSLEKAFKKNNRELYLEAKADIRTLSGYTITEDQSDKLLSLIVEESPERALEDAAWLYDNSPYYRPSLTLEYSVSGDGFSYSYHSSKIMKPGSEITLPDQESINANSNRLGRLKGWGVTKDDVTYEAGSVITMPLTDQTLYAIWTNEVSFSDPVSGIDVKEEGVSDGDEIALPEVPANSEGRVFIGWYDETTGEFIGPEAEIYTVRGNGAKFEALYADVEISDVRTTPYSTLPSNTQVTLKFNVENTGNEDFRNLEVSISSSDENLSILNDTLYFRRLPAGSVGTVSTRVVYTGTESAKAIPITVAVTDEDGNVWQSDFSLTSK